MQSIFSTLDSIIASNPGLVLTVIGLVFTVIGSIFTVFIGIHALVAIFNIFKKSSENKRNRTLDFFHKYDRKILDTIRWFIDYSSNQILELDEISNKDYKRKLWDAAHILDVVSQAIYHKLYSKKVILGYEAILMQLWTFCGSFIIMHYNNSLLNISNKLIHHKKKPSLIMLYKKFRDENVHYTSLLYCAKYWHEDQKSYPEPPDYMSERLQKKDLSPTYLFPKGKSLLSRVKIFYLLQKTARKHLKISKNVKKDTAV